MSSRAKRGVGFINEAGKTLTPGRTIRAYCLQCVGGNPQDVKACDATDPKYHVCPFHPFRLGRGRPSVKVIRKFCLDCMGGYKDFVRDCETKGCFCHPYRMGRSLAKRKGRTAEQMGAVRAGRGHLINENRVKF